MSMLGNKTVSIITPAYNAELFIRACIDSVRAQTWQDWQLLVVDDCSSDETPRILAEYQKEEPRLLTLRNPVNLGQARTRNVAIAKAEGRYIAFLDSDDVWLPHKLQTQIAFMEQSGASLSYTSYGKMLEDGTKTTRIVHVPPSVTYRQLLSHNVIGCLTAVYDTDQTGKHYMPEIKLRDDFALWLNILKAGHVARGIDEPLGYLRLRKGSLSSNKVAAAHQQWVFYRNVERLSLPRSTYHFLNYLVLSGLKHAL